MRSAILLRFDRFRYKAIVWHSGGKGVWQTIACFFSRRQQQPLSLVPSLAVSLVSERKTKAIIMSYPIPEPYVWDESFQVFYDLLDEEHKGLFKGVFDVAKAPGDAGALAHLKEVVDKHFSDEEGMMTKANYSDIVAHKAAHAEFVGKLKGLSTPVSSDTIHYAKEWLVNHIKGTDFKYKGKL